MKISLFTSIPARLDTRQLVKLENIAKLWKIAGARLISLNFSEEAIEHPLLATDFGITVVDCGPRSHSEYNNRPLVPIDIVVKAIQSGLTNDRIVGIVNADIYPNLLYDWSSIVSLVASDEVHVFKRLEDKDSCMQWEFDPFAPYGYGYDLFLFDRSTLPDSINNPDLYCFGVPWWDYWFPLMLKAEYGFKVISHDRPLIIHATHEERFSQHDWLKKAEILRRYIRLHADSLKHPKALSAPIDNILFCRFCVQIIDSQSYQDSLQAASRKDLKIGVSIVTACMDRNLNLMMCLPSWLQHPQVKEIIIVDWTSKNLLENDLLANNISDFRIKIFRVEEQKEWILSRAFNYGLSHVKYTHTLKLDADIMLKAGFFDQHSQSNDVFYAGNWRIARSDREKRVNGSFMAPTNCLAAVGYYNEYITTYGWDDCDLYERIENLIDRVDFDLEFISHVVQDDETRLANQSNRLGLNPITLPAWLNQEIEIRVNQIISRLAPRPHIDFRVCESWLIFVRLIAYRYSLSLKLAKSFENGGIGLPFKFLTRLDDFTLASMLSFVNMQFVSDIVASEGASFLECFLCSHPVSEKDYALLISLCSPIYQGRRPLLSITNNYAFPDILISRQASLISRKQVLRALSAPPIQKILAGTIASNLLKKSEKSDYRSEIAQKSSGKIFTSITVCVKSHKYQDGFLEDLLHILSKSNDNFYFVFIATPSSDSNDVKPFVRLLREQRSSVDLILLTWDPGLYDCWNIVCKETHSRYIGNWNCDDRRSDKHIGLLCNYLDNHPNAIGASSALLVSKRIPSSFRHESRLLRETWFSGESFIYDYRDMYQRETWRPGSGRIVSQNFMHCLPIWRKAIHELGEYFDEIQFGPSADWELWMRVSQKFDKHFYLHGDALGLYHFNLVSYGRSASADLLEERINCIYLSSSRVANEGLPKKLDHF